LSSTAKDRRPLPPISAVLSNVDQLPSGAETAVELAELLVQARHRAPVTSMSGQCDVPVQRTAATCNNAIQVTIYNCRNFQGSFGFI
jgi:pyruvate-formate lyase